MRGEYETAALFIGIAIVFDMLDGRIARLTGTASDFGVQFDSLADVISVRYRAGDPRRARGGCEPLGRLGYAGGFHLRERGGAAPGARRQHPERSQGGDKLLLPWAYRARGAAGIVGVDGVCPPAEPGTTTARRRRFSPRSASCRPC